MIVIGFAGSLCAAKVVTEFSCVPRIAGNPMTRKNRIMVYSVNEACQQLGIGRTLLYHLINTKQLDVIKLGRRTLVLQDSIQRLIAEKTGG